MAERTAARSSEVSRRRPVLLMLTIIALLATLMVGSWGKSSKWAPELALNLQGGTQIILTPETTDNSGVTQSDVNQATEVTRQRVDASDVAETEISSQGDKNVIVGLPGRPSKQTLRFVRTSAVMRTRPVLTITGDVSSLTPVKVASIDKQREEAQKSTGPSVSASPSASSNPSTSATSTPGPKMTYGTEELKEIAREKTDENHDGKISDQPKSKPTDASDADDRRTEKFAYDASVLDCAKPSSKLNIVDDPEKPLMACDRSRDQVTKYILGPAEIKGTQLTKASSGFDQKNNQWITQIRFDSKGTKAFINVTRRLVKLQRPRNQFAVVLDGLVISSAVPSEVISGGQARTSGFFTDQTAKTLANQLSFGSLPLKFDVQSEKQISAALGSEPLRGSPTAGAVGVALLALYLLWTYHRLGMVVTGSIALATGLSCLIIVLMSWTIGYRLSMADVVGFIISIGITANSFIVLFERIRDKVREGRSVRAAIAHGWHRAKRTIYVADDTNLLCSFVLYFLAVGSVRGFAFTLGLTTVLDLVMVVMFAYPVTATLVHGSFFGEDHRWSDMSAITLGNAPAYSGRGSFRHRSGRHVDVKLVVGEESSGSTVDTAVVVTEYSEDDGADAPGGHSPEGSSENRAASSRRSRKDTGFSRRGSAHSRKTEVEGDDAIGAGVNSVNDGEASHLELREGLSEEGRGLSLTERKALRRKKAREETRGDDFSGHAAQRKENSDA